MLWTVFVILLVLWLLGLTTAYTMGGFIHILLVLAVVALVFQLVTGRRVSVIVIDSCQGAEMFPAALRGSGLSRILCARVGLRQE
jgi:hypothetical protein